MHRSARFTRILAACAAVPVILTAAACSSDSGKDDGGKSDAGSPSSNASSGKDGGGATVAKAAFDELPEPCKALSGKTIDDLVHEVDDKSGKAGSSDDTDTTGSCYWKGLDTDGTKGSQYRWLHVNLQRYDSDATLGSGDKRAKAQLQKKVDEAKATEGAKNVKSEAVSGIGDEAVVVRFDQKKKEGDFKNQRVVARVENAVVVLDFNGAGLAGAKTPGADDMVKDAQAAAKEAVASVVAANKAGASGEDDSSEKPSDEAGDKASDKPSSKASKKSGNKKAE
ncbi:DUF3558 domain-containing protein [Streptomyces sp. NBC_01304]|uniref:DUF3558 domain-containing protein n=1 Tax=Streptomyces sp. NBC_01304 TaxID=2903818 RepID=UPI002E1173D8|nr:DUF3558 domain-containing protein [Streptomyces sp. NBC_01304]